MSDEFLGAFFDDLRTILWFDRHRCSKEQNNFITPTTASDTYRLRTRSKVGKFTTQYY